MLILTRKSGEVIRIGEEIVVRVLEVRGQQVRIGIEAPSAVRIYREEIYRAIERENCQAAAADVGRFDDAAALIHGDPTERQP